MKEKARKARGEPQDGRRARKVQQARRGLLVCELEGSERESRWRKLLTWRGSVNLIGKGRSVGVALAGGGEGQWAWCGTL